MASLLRNNVILSILLLIIASAYERATAFNSYHQQTIRPIVSSNHQILSSSSSYEVTNNYSYQRRRTIHYRQQQQLYATPQLKDNASRRSSSSTRDDTENDTNDAITTIVDEASLTKNIEIIDETSLNGKNNNQQQQSQITNNLKSSSSSSSATTITKNNDYSGLLWRGVVIALCAFWASNFAAAKLVMGEPGVDSSLYALSRFGIAAIALLPGSILSISKGNIDYKTAKSAAICGCWVAFGYLGQTIGLLTTTASRSCVICTLHCVFVAIIAEAMRVSRATKSQQQQQQQSMYMSAATAEADNDDDEMMSIASSTTASFDFTRLIPAIVAVIGVAIVELKGAGGSPTIGDLISFAQPIGFGMGYLQLEDIMKENPQAALPVSAIKLAMVAFFSFLMFELSPILLHSSGGGGGISDAFASLSFQIPNFTPILSSPTALGGILYTGIITTAVALWVESIAFKRVPAKDASIILTTEPLFAAVAGSITLGETFGMSDYVGATLIVGACVLAVLIDDAASDEECFGDDELNGICELPRTLPISAD